jgi:hypothetical protein
MDNKNKKLLTWAAVLVGGYVVYKAIQSSNAKKLQSGYPYSPDPNGGGVITTTFNASKTATEIFNAMDGYGTDESAIVAAFNKVKSDADFDALVRAFGVRTISSGSGNIFVSDFTGDLSECLNDELSSYWIDDINSSLQKKGVTKTI